MRSIIIILLLSITSPLFSQLVVNSKIDKINWISIEEAEEKAKTDFRPWLIFIETPWCGWCKHMRKTTLSNPNIASYINTNFLPVMFNAESKDTIIYGGKKYANNQLGKSRRPTHSLTYTLIESKRITYPTVLFKNPAENYNLISMGSIDVKKIQSILVYSNERAYKTTSLDAFRAQFDEAINIGFRENSLIPWISLEEAEKRAKVDGKKLFVMLTADPCFSCKTMLTNSFGDSADIKELEKYYHFVKIDIFSKEVIKHRGQTFTPDKNINGLHPFVSKVIPQFQLPNIFLIEPSGKVILSLPLFIDKSILKNIGIYYGKDLSNSISWEKYLQKQSHK